MRGKAGLVSVAALSESLQPSVLTAVGDGAILGLPQVTERRDLGVAQVLFFAPCLGVSQEAATLSAVGI